jgi:Haem-binding domain
MANIRKSLKIAGLVIVIVLILSQAIRIDRSNPPVRSDISAGPAIQPILRRACYNCHSNETVWPWYSRVAPASWLVGSDVSEGRQLLNFSEWGSYAADVRSRKLAGITKEIQEGEMPPWYYSIAHSESRLSQSERDQIVAWAIEAAGSAAK